MDQQTLINKIVNNTEDFINEVKEMDCVLNNKIEYLSDMDMMNKYKPFIISDYWTDSQIVNIFDIVGTQHPDYAGYTWIDMLKIGKRMRSINLPLLIQNPGYYFELSKKEPFMHFVKINNKLYIGSEGNHRTAIAKVLFYFLKSQNFGKIFYNEYVVDFEFMELYKKLKSTISQKALPLIIDVIKEKTKRDDSSGWKKDFYKINVKILNIKKPKTLILNKKEIIAFINELEHFNFIKKIFKTGTYLRQIL